MECFRDAAERQCRILRIIWSEAWGGVLLGSGVSGGPVCFLLLGLWLRRQKGERRHEGGMEWNERQLGLRSALPDLGDRSVDRGSGLASPY